jgi:excinuclease ABC subunit A
VIEHNLDVIKTADWLVDMGPEGGSRGGTVVAEGTPEAVAAVPESYTGQFLKPLLDGREAEQQPMVKAAAVAGRGGAKATKTAAAKKAAAKRAAVKRAG